MESLATQLELSIQTGIVERSIELPMLAILLRNVLFLLVVLAHGLRRLLPPF